MYIYRIDSPQLTGYYICTTEELVDNVPFIKCILQVLSCHLETIAISYNYTTISNPRKAVFFFPEWDASQNTR